MVAGMVEGDAPWLSASMRSTLDVANFGSVVYVKSRRRMARF
jgi:hypothetical protein